ncbi:hypothetical protein CN273_19710 [Bacillus thuringiensis]|uniref:GNAT family N-acetyltransferase n=1 Tax=Bacillus thuringiensis TaxID=1428 RepID=UPI000BF9D154|nr:GNAT family protein [Bacillus thuringiensis]PFB81505.1 hypothetical protein CN273_19710 [Bacillus thuringiensis]PFJ58061.1 hypothetical protein COJ10_25660 [Bacillus thuringiensis]
MLNIYVNEKITLHLIERRHIDSLHKLYVESQHAIEKWIPAVEKIVNNKSLLNKLIDQWLDVFVKGEGLYLAIQYKNKMSGIVSLDIDKFNRSGSIGLWLHPDCMGKKVALLSACKMIDTGFSEYNLNRIGAETAIENRKVSLALEKLNFRKEGIKRAGCYINNTAQDLILYGMLKEDWKKNKIDFIELNAAMI